MVLKCYSLVWLLFIGLSVLCQLGPVEGGVPLGVSWHYNGGDMKHVSVGRAGVWGVNENDQIHYLESSYGDENNAGDGWTLVSGGLMQVDVGDNIVWGVSSNGSIFYRKGIYSSDPTGAVWVPVAGKLKHVTVSQKGHVWGVAEHDNIIYHRIGVTKCKRAGDSWRRIIGSLSQISMGSGGVWGVNSANAIFYREGTYGDPDSDTDGTSWTRVTGGLTYISSADVTYGVNGGWVYYRAGVSADYPMGTTWVIILGSLKQIEALSLSVWGVNSNDYVFAKQTN